MLAKNRLISERFSRTGQAYILALLHISYVTWIIWVLRVVYADRDAAIAVCIAYKVLRIKILGLVEISKERAKLSDSVRRNKKHVRLGLLCLRQRAIPAMHRKIDWHGAWARPIMVRHLVCRAQVTDLCHANAASSYGGLLLFIRLLLTGNLKVKKMF